MCQLRKNILVNIELSQKAKFPNKTKNFQLKIEFPSENEICQLKLEFINELCHCETTAGELLVSLHPAEITAAPILACSVASLSHSPGYQLPDDCSLHCNSLADYLFVLGETINIP